MFKMAFLQVDYKDLEMIKDALENKISNLNNQVYTTDDDKEVIDKHKQLLKKVNKKIDFVLGNN